MGETLDSYLRRVYQMTEDEYNLQLTVQGGLCAACRQPNQKGRDREPERLSVDHSHYSGANPGLLCQRCNKVLGLVDDSQEILLLLFEYLRRYDGSQIPGIEGSEIRRALQIIRTADTPDSLPGSDVSSQSERDPIEAPAEGGTGEPQKIGQC